MTLAGRLSASFLTALAVVLVGFSMALQTLAVQHLHRVLEERLAAALTTLAAAAEVGPDGVEWEPDERVLGVGQDEGADQVRWVVRDSHGGLIDQSPNLNLSRLSPGPIEDPKPGPYRGRDGRTWMVKSKRLTTPSSTRPTTAARSQEHALLAEGKYSTLVLVGYAPLGPTEATLRRLGLTLVVLSTSLWLAAAAFNRRLCRRGLAPLTEMAVAARVADAENRHERLPVPKTGDELEALGQAFNGLLDRLHETLEQQKRFTGDASHQLRTPLAGLLGQVDVVLRRDRPPEEYRRVLGIVRRKAVHLQQIIESLLFLARTEVEAGRPEPAFIDLVAWVSDHLKGWTSHPRGNDIQLDLRSQLNVHVDGANSTRLGVRVHPPLLAQAFDNLLDNACKYSQMGTPIMVRLERTSVSVTLIVEDHGEGFSPEVQSRLFEPFFRAPETSRRDQPGVGLGLAVVRRIITSFGGTITGEGILGRGSCFTILLPMAMAPPPEVQVLPES